MAKIPDLPETERPRERLARLGASALSDAELLAIFLRTGVQGASAIEVGRQLLKKFGSLNSLGALSVQQLSREHGLGPAKAAQLLASFELGARCATERILNRPLRSAEDIYRAIAPRIAHLSEEKLLVVLLDAKLNTRSIIEVGQGSSTSVICHPRDVLHHVLINKASAYILCHNHPSGDPSPSESDDRLTQQLVTSSRTMEIRFIEHLIIGRPSTEKNDRYYSYAEHGKV